MDFKPFVNFADDGNKVREEAVEGVFNNSREWEAVKDGFLSWARGYEGKKMNFDRMNKETGELEAFSWDLQHSYTENYARKYYAKMKLFERVVSRKWESVGTCMITLTGTNTPENEFMAPAEHLHELNESYKRVIKRIRYNMNKVSDHWEYMVVVEPHKSGYAHFHLILAVDLGDKHFEDSDLMSVGKMALNNHVRNCRLASKEAHDVHAGSTLSIRTDEIDGVGDYLAEYMAKFFVEDEDENCDDIYLERIPEYLQRFYALVWATGTRRIRFSQGANRMIKEQWRKEKIERGENVDQGQNEIFDWVNGVIIDEDEEVVGHVNPEDGGSSPNFVTVGERDHKKDAESADCSGENASD